MGKYKSIEGVVLNIITILVLLITFLPLVWFLEISLKPPVLAFKIPPVWIFKPDFSNYVSILREVSFIKSYLNTTIIALSATGLTLLLSIPVAYTLARRNFKGKKIIGLLILTSRMAPAMAFLIPFYMLCRALGLLGTYLSAIIAYQTFTLAFVVWLMVGFFKSIPVELEEAAVIDGCTRIGVLLRIVLPLAKSGLASCTIISFIWSWNQFFYPLVLLSAGKRPATMAIMEYMGYTNVNWPGLAAASALVILPILIFALLSQRELLRGLTAGAIK